MNTIGRYYEVSLSSAMNNTYEFYVPLASDTMSLDELQTNAAKLQAMVDNWTAIANDPGNNSTETNNAWSIVQILQGRLDEYNRRIAIKLQSETPADTGGDQYTDPGTGEPKKDYTMLLLIGAGIGAMLLLKKKKGRSVKGSSSKSSFMLPLLIGGGIVYYFANKKYGQATTQPMITETATRTFLPGEPIPGEVITNPIDIPLGGGGTVYVDDPKDIYNETLNYTN